MLPAPVHSCILEAQKDVKIREGEFRTEGTGRETGQDKPHLASGASHLRSLEEIEGSKMRELGFPFRASLGAPPCLHLVCDHYEVQSPVKRKKEALKIQPCF